VVNTGFPPEKPEGIDSVVKMYFDSVELTTTYVLQPAEGLYHDELEAFSAPP